MYVCFYMKVMKKKKNVRKKKLYVEVGSKNLDREANIKGEN